MPTRSTSPNQWMTWLFAVSIVLTLVTFAARYRAALLALLTVVGFVCVVVAVLIWLMPKRVDEFLQSHPLGVRPVNLLASFLNLPPFPRHAGNVDQTQSIGVQPPSQEALRNFFQEILKEDMPGFDIPLYIARKELNGVINSTPRVGTVLPPGILATFALTGSPGIGKHYFADSLAHAFFLCTLPPLFPQNVIEANRCRICFNTSDVRPGQDQFDALYERIDEGLCAASTPWCYVVVEQSSGQPLTPATLRAVSQWIDATSLGKLPKPDRPCLLFLITHVLDAAKPFAEWSAFESIVRKIVAQGVSEELVARYARCRGEARIEMQSRYFADTPLQAIPMWLSARTDEQLLAAVWQNVTRYAKERFKAYSPDKNIDIVLDGDLLVTYLKGIRNKNSLRSAFLNRDGLDNDIARFICELTAASGPAAAPHSLKSEGVAITEVTGNSEVMTCRE